MPGETTLFEFPLVRPVGLSGILVSFGNRLTDEANRANLAFRATFESQNIAGVTETSSSLVSTLIAYDPLVLTQDQITGIIHSKLDEHTWGAAPLPSGRKRWKVPVSFGGEHGPQLEEAANLAGVSSEQAIQDFTAQPLRVMSIGFAPGQPYLGSLPDHWDIPRQQGLTPEVPAASLVVAVRQLVLYASAAPTGWRRVGQTAFQVFRPGDVAPFRLNASDEILFEQVSPTHLQKLLAENTDGLGGATYEALSE